MKPIKSLVAAALLAGTVASAHAATLFADDFEGNPSQQIPGTPTGWLLTGDGSVDVVKIPNGFGISQCGITPSDTCIDLDGTTAGAPSNPKLYTAQSFDLHAGTAYTLSIEASGNQRHGSDDTLKFGFLDSALSEIATVAVSPVPGDLPWQIFSASFTFGTDVLGARFFLQDGGAPADFIGPLVDNVSISAVPLPAAAWLLLSGLGGVAAFARRRRAAAA